MKLFESIFIYLVAALIVFSNYGVGNASDHLYRGHGIAMHGKLKYPDNFRNFEYVNPRAPKGGAVRLGSIGGYDTFNTFIIKGRKAAGLNRIYDTLMESSADEPFSMYGVLAESIEVPKDRSWAVFTLRKGAYWHDGRPISAADLIWSFNFLLTKGHPYYRFYYGNVSKVEKIGERQVKFSFEPGKNRELPLILGQLQVFPKHYWENRDPTKTTLIPPLGSGPYKIKSYEPNRSITYERVENYWGRELPVNRGRHNFRQIVYEYFRDGTVALEAFKAGRFDFRQENSSKAWATGYKIPALKKGFLLKRSFKHERTQGMQGFVFNTRRQVFNDRRVREALSYAFDFEWSNKTLFYSQYKRTESFFANSELSALGMPSAEELVILEPYRTKLPQEVFSSYYTAPETDGSGNNRDNLRKARNLLKRAGWKFDRGLRRLVHQESGQPLEFEILLVSPLFERIALPFKKNLKKLGIIAHVRTVDSAQYQKRTQSFDFDMVVTTWGQSSSPGNEQRMYWTSNAADRTGSRNLSGLKNNVVDELVEGLIAASDRKKLVAHSHALDRVLLWQHLVIPHWHTDNDRIVYWNRFGMPVRTSKNGIVFSAWWIDPKKDFALRRAGYGAAMRGGR